MFDFGDELSVESYRIPWLIWIQLLVIFLLIALLYCFTIFALDPSDDTATTTTLPTAKSTTAPIASASTSRLVFDDIQQMETPLAKQDSTPTVVIHRRQNTQGLENLSIKGEIATVASRMIASGEEVAEREASSLSLHPCNYFQLARIAFLKCLGLDSTSDVPSTQKRRKRKES